MFERGVRFMEEMKFAEMHVFPYSKRTGTPAARMDEQVDEEEKHERVHRLIDLSEKMQLAYAQPWVGRELEVIPERVIKGSQGNGQLGGYSDNYLNVVFEGAPELIGKLVKVRIREAGVNECIGRLEGLRRTVGVS
jgi:threonylcarbamoyladenosine tRNA methylthiotransferase MtaB